MSGRTRRHAWTLEVRRGAKSRIRLYKAMCRDLVFGSSALQQIEFKGAQILRELTGALFENYLAPARSRRCCSAPDVHRDGHRGGDGSRPARACSAIILPA